MKAERITHPYFFRVDLTIYGAVRTGSNLEFERTIKRLSRHALDAFADSLPGRIYEAGGGCGFNRLTDPDRQQNATIDFPPAMDVMP